MDVSPYLSAIQSLNGQNPGDKYKELHSIAAQIIKNDKQKADFVSTGRSESVQPALLPHLRILVGNKLKSNEAIIEALKSDDVTIIKQALGAKWFFSSSNELIRVDYFVNNVVPHISMRTRLQLIKTLASCLIGEPKKAEDFFLNFSHLYGIVHALPLIVACSEKFIYAEVLKRKLLLPSRILGLLYRRYPQLVIRYLQLGNEKNKDNEEDRKSHKIDLSSYTSFLPVLVKHHTKEFAELYECMPPYTAHLKLGNTRAEFFLKNATDLLIAKPQTFLELLPLKLVNNKLSTQQFETMFTNLFALHDADSDVYTMIQYLEYYPIEKRSAFLLDKHKELFGKDLLSMKNVINSEMVFKFLTNNDLKEQCAKKVLAPLEGTPAYYEEVYRLPPKQSLPILKERVAKPSEKPRSHWIRKMIVSCSIYDSKEDLLEVLRYYNQRHKNEQAFVLHEVLASLLHEFDIKTLDKEHWQVLKEILQRSYVKGDTESSVVYVYEPLFKGALCYYLKQCKGDGGDEENRAFLDKLVNIILECYLERGIKWDFLTVNREIERDCLQKFLAAVPEKYPETHKIWSKDTVQLELTLNFIKAMNEFNRKNFCTESKKKYRTETSVDSEGNEIKQTRFTIQNYPWLTKFAKDMLKSKYVEPKKTRWQKRLTIQDLKKQLRIHDLKFYQSVIDDDPDMVNEVDTNDALAVLKHTPHKILDKWKQYLNACRQKLEKGSRSAKHLVASTKWHQDIPIKFVEQSLLEIDEKGSTYILGILLDGETLGKLVQPYLPKDMKMDVDGEDAKKTYVVTSSLPKAMNFTNPPVSFDVIVSFCQGDYVSLATQTLTNVAQRVPVDKVLAFANQLVNKPISVKKLGIRLVFQVATKTEMGGFLKQIWEKETHLSIRELIVNMIFDVFKQSPNEETWSLIKTCIGGLTFDDQNALKVLKNIACVDQKFVAKYIYELLKKVDQLNEFDEESKSQFIRSVVDEIDKNILDVLPEELITDILKKQLLKYSQQFVVKVYLLSSANKFETRLKTFMEILQQELTKFDQSDPNRHRYYPTNYKVRTFFDGFIKQASISKGEMSLKVIDSVLNLFTKILSPWQEPRTFIALCACKSYIEANTPEEFGAKFSAAIPTVIEKFGSEVFLDNIKQAIYDIICGGYRDQKVSELKLTVIEGMMKSSERYGALIGIRLLKPYEIDDYDERFDKLLKIWKESKDVAVKATIYEFLNDAYY